MAISPPTYDGSDLQPLSPRKSFGSDEGMRTRSSSLCSVSAGPSRPASGTQTPAICRPLLRRRSSSHDGKLRHVSEETIPQLHTSLRKAQGWLSGKTTFSPRHRKNSSQSSMEPQTSQRTTGEVAHLHSATQMPRPAGPKRRVSHVVHEREKSLRNELDRLRSQVKDQEERKQEEIRTVEFAVNRIVETQMNHMKVQQVLLDRVAALDLQAKEAKDELRRAKKESRRSSDDTKKGSRRSSDEAKR